MVKLTELKCWKWLPGMRGIVPDHQGGVRVIRLGEEATNPGGFGDHRYPCDSGTYGNPRAVDPDINDPATLGAIMFGILAPLGWRMARGAWAGFLDCLLPGDAGKAAFTHRQHGFTEWLPLKEAIEAALRMEG